MRKTIMVLTPTSTGTEKISGRIRLLPRDGFGLLEKFQMLDNLGKNNREESFVTSHQSIFSSHKVTNHSGKEYILGKKLHNTSGGRFRHVPFFDSQVAPGAGSLVVNSIDFITSGFIRRKEIKIWVALHFLRKQSTKSLGGRFSFHESKILSLDQIVH